MSILCWIFDIKKHHNELQEQFDQIMNTYVYEKSEYMQIKKVFNIDKYRSLIGRLMIYKMIKVLIPDKTNYKDIKLSRTKYNKPYLIDYPAIQFNISHDGNYVILIATSNHHIKYIGCDIMYIDVNKNENFFKHMSYCFTDLEWKLIYSYNDKILQYKEFYKLWTMKESYLKAIGIGIGYELKNVEFLQVKDQQYQVKSYDKNYTHLDKTWYIETIDIDHEHIISIMYSKNNQYNRSNDKHLFEFVSLSQLIC